MASAAAQAQVAPKPAEPATAKANAAVLRTLPFADHRDFDDAMRGFVGTLPDALIAGTGPRPVMSMKPYDFEKQEAPPDTVNPSLWRQAQLNAIHGLFKVTDRVYQVRGFDIANMTIIEGDTSLIIIDATTTAESAKAGLELYYQYRPRKRIGTVIYSHNHADHFGGVKGLISEDDVALANVHLLAPPGFMDAVMSESIIAGTAMSRRSFFQFGVLVPPGPRGHVDGGLGKRIANGALTLIAPNIVLDKPIETRTLDGIEIVFKQVPEAPKHPPKDADVFPAVPRARHGRGRDAHHAQPLHHPRCRGARRQPVVTLHLGCARILWRQDRHPHCQRSITGP